MVMAEWSRAREALRAAETLTREHYYAARGIAMILESSRSEAPSVMREWMRRSRETEESPASILATRD
jgi:hypothetical protein